MKESCKFTIVYVFGPLQCADKYKKNETLSRETGEWVKIGETEYNGPIDEEAVMKKAMNRINGETRTGIPVLSMIYDVFLFPYKSHTDNKVRGRLCSELYSHEDSKKINQQHKDDQFVIKAGVEFVYGVCRKEILYAVQSVDHDILSSTDDEEQIKLIAQLFRFNNKKLYDIKEDNETALGSRKPHLDLDTILEVGDEIVLTKDGKKDAVVDENNEIITAKYIGGNEFECRDEVGRTSPLAKKYLNQYGDKNVSTINGNEYWTFKGQKLTLLRRD